MRCEQKRGGQILATEHCIPSGYRRLEVISDGGKPSMSLLRKVLALTFKGQVGQFPSNRVELL